jgi:hypothetical protein
MNRSRVVVVLSLVWAMAGCQSLFESDSARSGLSGTGPDGGVCTKDPQTIKNVMLAPPVCSATNPCPCGTYCSSQTGGNCVADCVDDSWCAPGFTCSAFGQCLNAGPADGGGTSTTTNPTCPTNSALLNSLTTNPRSCQFDDQCPFGSYCDHLSELCRSDCRSDSACAQPDGGGQTFVCDCLGQCAAVGAPTPKPTAILPTMEVSPTQFLFNRPATITTPVWDGAGNKRQIAIDVVSQFVNKSPDGTTVTGPAPTIQANPGPGLMVQCPGTSAPSASPCSFTIDPTKLALVNGVYKSPAAVVTLAPSSGAPTATTWTLRLTSPGIQNAPQTVTLRYADLPASAAVAPNLVSVTPIESIDPTFTGEGEIDFTTPTGMQMTIPVSANVQPTCFSGPIGCGNALVIYDPTQQLSPSGKLVMRPPQFNGDLEQFLDPESDSDQALSTSFSPGNSLLQRVVGVSLTQDTTSGTVSGSFSLSVYTDFLFNPDGGGNSDGGGNYNGPPASPFDAPLTGTFRLNRTSIPSGLCTKQTDCPGNQICDLGFCSVGPPHRTEASTSGSNPEIYVRNMAPNNWYFNTRFVPSNLGLLSIYGDSTDASVTIHGPFPAISGLPSGDLFAANGSSDGTNQSPLAIPLLTQHDGNFTSSASQLLAACLSELALPAYDPATFNSFTQCLNLGRVLAASGDPSTFQEMLEGALTVGSFIAREGLEERQMTDALANAGIDASALNSQLPQAPSLTQILSTTEEFLGFFLESGSAQGGFYQYMTPAAIWSSVDYRTLIKTSCAGSGCPNGLVCNPTSLICQPQSLTAAPQYQETVGVPTFALQTAAAYLRVLQAYLKDVAAQNYGAPADADPDTARSAALSHYGTAMRLVLAVEQLATGINRKVGFDPVNGTCPSPTSASDCAIIVRQFNNVKDEMNALRAQVVGSAQAIQNATNPFNIPEDDVPLFFGDPSGTSSQYFAASDYLLNGWALPAATQSQSFLDAARGAWIQQSQAAVQDELNQHNRQQEIGNLMSKYGAPILANCGNLQVSDGQGGLRDLDSTQVIPYFQTQSNGAQSFPSGNCYIDQKCVAGSNGIVDPKIVLQQSLKNAFLNGSSFLTDPGNNGVTQVAEFMESELCKITYLRPYVPNDQFVSILSSICPGDDYMSGGSAPQCTVSLGGDGNIYFGSPSTKIPLAAFYGPISSNDIGAGKFYASAANVFGAKNSTNAYKFTDYRNSNASIVIGTQLTATGQALYNACVHIGGGGTAPGGVPPSCFPGVTGKTSTNMTTTQVKALENVVFNASATQACENGGIPTSGPAPSAPRVPIQNQDYPRPADGLLPANCYKGQMGVTFEEIQADSLRIQRAVEVLNNGQANLLAQKNLCESIDRHIASIQQLEGDFSSMQQDYQIAAAFGGLLQAGIAAFTDNPAGAVGSLVSTGLGLFGDSVTDEQTKLQQMETNFSDDEKSQECWNTFLADERNQATAMTDVQIATTDLKAQQVVFQNYVGQNALNLQEGIAVLNQEQGSPVSSLGHQFWVDEKVEQFKNQFEWTRRLSYLAMRAIEYEFQQSLPYRSNIVSAKTPADLQTVLIGLQSEEAARTINRRRPDEASVVLSLRDDVLAIPNNSSAPSGERNWSPAQRFESRLSDQKYAYRDGQGNYLGQAIPFTLAPTGILETRCGERLWTATATIQGDGIETSAPGASVLLLKRNTFESQYCSGHGQTDPTGNTSSVGKMQVGVIHTSADLFQPGSQVDLSDTNEFTASLLYPWFNIPKTEFYATSYQNGSSQELAGRGLYGDYVLLFPQQVLSEGFALGNVEDVLLRFDYLSIDNLSQ